MIQLLYSIASWQVSAAIVYDDVDKFSPNSHIMFLHDSLPFHLVLSLRSGILPSGVPAKFSIKLSYFLYSVLRAIRLYFAALKFSDERNLQVTELYIARMTCRVQ
jgi:hypothetical protein